MTKRDRRRRGPSAIEDVAARAARLGITPDRVLQEYARIAFADLRDIADWGPGEDGLNVKPSGNLAPGHAAAIAEIVAAAKGGKIYRIKLHDKKPVLDALGRHLGMLPPLKTGPYEEEQLDEDEDPREFLIREVDRLAAEEAEGSGDPGVEQ